MGKRGKTSLEKVEEITVERLAARAVSKVAGYATPWITGLMISGMGAGAHVLWGDAGAAPWAAMAETIGTVGLAAAAVAYSSGRAAIVRWHMIGTLTASGTWVTVTTIAGMSPKPVWSLWVGGGVLLALSWNLRQAVMAHSNGEDMPGGDRISELIKSAARAVGVETKAVRLVEATDRQATVKATFEGGGTAADMQKKAAEIESAAKLPPGSINITPDEDRADQALVTTSDPRVLHTALPWPGPSRPGGSIAEPLCIGIWQDGEDVQHVIVGHHVQFMGKTGSGKSEGGAWNYLAEIVSRMDAVVIAADITKRDQFLGPLRPALHRFDTTKTGVRSQVADMHRAMGERMDYLTEKGLTKWQPGCGLSYLVWWLEEFPDIGDTIDMQRFLSIVKALRSGGGTIVMSLQRSDWTQMPTIARGQLAKMCFAVDSDDDAEFGLSSRQDKNPSVQPDQWATCGPDTVGMAYLDAPSIPIERVSMALRTWNWNSDTDALRAHAETFSTVARPADPVTARCLLGGAAPAAGGADERPELDDDRYANEDQEEDELGGELDGDPIAQHVRSADPNPENTAGPDDAIDETGYDGWTFEEPERPVHKMPTAEARALLIGQLSQWYAAGRTHFRAGDLRPVWETAGRKRAWSGRFLREELLPAGIIAEDDERGGYVITRDPDADAEVRALVPA
ncbi:hypothetical protein [Actinomadura terrae]|uniref:hypothetical protein n=1 Tax=Actinomadura terrae TaxID=604353 RepID=UPI001FA7160E|nr:hypothetical protein [Actinomadura terrae]